MFPQCRNRLAVPWHVGSVALAFLPVSTAGQSTSRQGETGSDAACKSKTAKRVGFWSSTAVLVLGTAKVANVKGASWSRSLPGSAAGFLASALSLGLAADANLDWVGVLASVPIHAGITALFPVLWE